MDKQEIIETPIWQLYQEGLNYQHMVGMITDTDRNYRMYNGDQWAGAKLGGVEPVQKNFIKPIVKYKVAVVHDNLYAIVYSSMNYEDQAFRREAEKICSLLSGRAARVWEQDKMDFKGRRLTKDAAINDEGILYIDFDKETMMPKNEVLDKNDVFYGNENDDNIQEQPFILIRKRMPVSNARDFARNMGLSEDKLPYIVGDNDTLDLAGDAAKKEKDDQVTLVYKLYKEQGTVHFSVSTRWMEILEDTDMGISLYPLAHMVWEEKKGSARGEGEVRYLIPNQIEVNKMEMRRVLTVKSQAFPIKVVNTSKITNPQDLNKAGGIVKINDATVDDVRKIFGIIPPAQMSPDVVQLQNDLITVTRELAGAGDIATGQINPESASGRAILAVQQASQAPMTEQKESYKNFVEDVARIWLEYIIVHAKKGISMERTVQNPATGEETVEIVNVSQEALKKIQASVKIDVTPKSVYDRFAQEKTIENLLVQGFLSAQRLSELETYYKILPNDAVAPKVAIGEAIRYMKEEQKKIAKMQAQAQALQQRAAQFLGRDPQGQAQQIAYARQKAAARQIESRPAVDGNIDSEAATAS